MSPGETSDNPDDWPTVHIVRFSDLRYEAHATRMEHYYERDCDCMGHRVRAAQKLALVQFAEKEVAETGTVSPRLWIRAIRL